MCALCGGLIGGRHWADGGSDAGSRRRERHDRIRFLNKVLRHFEMEVRAWGRDGYLLTGNDVPAQLAENLPALWARVEEARGAKCSPLNSALLAALAAP